MTQALAELPKLTCDVLISRIGLPDGSGWELLQRLHEGNGRTQPTSLP